MRTVSTFNASAIHWPVVVDCRRNNVRGCPILFAGSDGDGEFVACRAGTLACVWWVGNRRAPAGGYCCAADRDRDGECSGEEISLSECYVSFVSHVCNYIT